MSKDNERLLNKTEEVLTFEEMVEHVKRYDDLQALQAEYSDYVKTERARNDDKTILFENEEGKHVTIKERVLWRDLLAEKIQHPELIERYPKLKEYIDREIALKEEVIKFEVNKFGFTHREMTFGNLVRLITTIMQLVSKNDVLNKERDLNKTAIKK